VLRVGARGKGAHGVVTGGHGLDQLEIRETPGLDGTIGRPRVQRLPNDGNRVNDALVPVHGNVARAPVDVPH